MMRSCLTIAGIFLLLASCGGSDNTADAPNCVRQAGVEAFNELAQIEIDNACVMDVGDEIKMRFQPLPDAAPDTCEFVLVTVSSNEFPTPVVNLGFLVGENTFSGAFFSLRDYYFADRLSANSDFSGAAGEGPCSDTSIEVTELTCRESYDREAPKVSCGLVSFEGTDMFASFTERDR